MTRSRYRQALKGPTKTFNATFTVDEMHALELYAAENRMGKAKVLREALRVFVAEELSFTPPPACREPDPKPSLANTEEGFKMGVEAACELISKNSRLKLKMTTGTTLGQDIASRIMKALIG